MSGLLQGFVWRAEFGRISLFDTENSESIDLDCATSKAVLAHIADALHDSGTGRWALGRCIIAQNLKLSEDRVKKIQRGYVRLGVLTTGDNKGGRGEIATYEIDVSRMIDFVPAQRLPEPFRSMKLESERTEKNRVAADENRGVGDTVSEKPGRGEGETGSWTDEKPGRGRPATNVRLTNDFTQDAQARAREASSEPDGSMPRPLEAVGDGEKTERVQRPNAEGSGNGITERAEREARLCADFISRDRMAERCAHRWRWPTGFQAFDRGELEAAIAALSWQGLSRAASWVDWAERFNRGEAVKPVSQVKHVAELAAAIKDAPADEAALEAFAPGGDRLEARMRFAAAKRAAFVVENCLRARREASADDHPATDETPEATGPP